MTLTVRNILKGFNDYTTILVKVYTCVNNVKYYMEGSSETYINALQLNDNTLNSEVCYWKLEEIESVEEQNLPRLTIVTSIKSK